MTTTQRRPWVEWVYVIDLDREVFNFVSGGYGEMQLELDRIRRDDEWWKELTDNGAKGSETGSPEASKGDGRDSLLKTGRMLLI